ncbi:hypothetical protein FGU65_01545 [Methanoculleus sp. FWC-SCC1]|uniref:Uncharacterized protein n=1 Tax=Methanoculleus frigidifontis TaxID=2584085 RepID=A0ABT8M6M3_9EURY|nr:hypothetical protein [Methanoculleus sp. FWC-SCC1]MDN7023593.1 hypothetical protein [Methanoculleus sp. FWC-SCC1]
MQILGVRSSTEEVWYAILEFNGDKARFVNAVEENRLTFPASAKNPEEKIYWLYQELDRVLSLYTEIERIALKMAEHHPGGQKNADREIAYYDSVILLVAAQRRKTVSVKRYTSIGTNSSRVKTLAEEITGLTEYNWAAKLADAVAVAWSEREKIT